MKQKKVLVVVTLLIVFLIVLSMFLIKNNAVQEKKSTVLNDTVKIEGQPTQGENSAPVSIVEFGDYKCPSCKQWGETVYPKLKKEFIDTGKVQFSYINVLFHGEESILAAKASESVYRQDKKAFWTFHKAIYDAQPRVEQHDDPWVTEESLLRIAAKSVPGINQEQLTSDLRNNADILDEVSKDDALVKEHGVELTPTIVINGIKLDDPFDYDTISHVIEEQVTADE
ncbi:MULTISPECIES: DsbA family protein [Exiguobacterium]|jgi:protein-disulfide isomerase|uniref:DsbA family protein n=1 Tax=Exiguobacterium TaxID=33986 RepID=UPI001BEC00D8|nr:MULTISPECIES: DsbA family protein [Exiguobacterium]MCT4791072.1 DsbA family protein [Exiguobacterium artemiae]